MNYEQFLEHIYQRHSGNVKLGLDRMLAILQSMNHPEQKLSGFHIAGTNGKGSTAAMIEAISIYHNLSTGLNTSPHLVDYRERIRINRNQISFDELYEIYTKFEHIFNEYEASFFEITTAIAFYYFYIKNVDVSIFEVGLGGRLDGTNPFNSDIAVITTIAYDHTKSLGNSLEKIAFEKAGIIKEDKPVVLGKLPKVALDKINEVAKEKNAQVFQYDKYFSVSHIKLGQTGTTFDFHSDILDIKNVTTNLLGYHQATNAGVAVYAFIKYMQIKGLRVDYKKIKNALKNVIWKGRMQILSYNPTVIIDGAHNEEGISLLVKNIREIFPDKKIYFVMAILRDKKLDAIIKMISSIAYKIYISKNNSTRAAELDIQEDLVKKYHNNYTIIPDVANATEKAIKEASDDDVVLISGSLYTISEVLKNYIF